MADPVSRVRAVVPWLALATLAGCGVPAVSASAAAPHPQPSLCTVYAYGHDARVAFSGPGAPGWCAQAVRAWPLRDRSYHSGNWGGLLRNPATVLASAVASLIDRRGRITIPAWRPPPIGEATRTLLAAIPIGAEGSDPGIDPDWGEPGLTPAERLIGWNTIEVLSLAAGNPDTPVSAIPGTAHAHCQLRFVAGTNVANLRSALRDHLDEHGFAMVRIEPGPVANASRTDADDRWVRFALASLERTSGTAPALLPNIGGTLPNDAFTDILGIPTIWIPHSYRPAPSMPRRAPAPRDCPAGAAADGGVVLGSRRAPARRRRPCGQRARRHGVRQTSRTWTAAWIFRSGDSVTKWSFSRGYGASRRAGVQLRLPGMTNLASIARFVRP